MARCGWAPSHAASPSSRSRERVSSTPPPRLTRDGAPRSATVEGRDYLRGQPFELLEHALGRAHGPHDELRGPARDVLLEPLGEERRRTKGRAGGERPLVHAAARDERRGGRVGTRGVVVEPEVHEDAEVVAPHLAPGEGRVGARLPAARNSRSCSTPIPTAGSARPPER